jgi:SAM-dependent methyltransferase
VTKALGSYVTTIRGIDISENMVSHYNEAARSSGLSTEQAHAVVGDLLGATVPPELSGPDFYNFDVAAIGLGFHHFEDPPLAVKRLAERLKAETGVLIIVDFLPFEHGSHSHGGGSGGHTHHHGQAHNQDQHTQSKLTQPNTQHTIKHHGFTSDGIQRLFSAAGLEDFAFDILPEPAVFEFEEGRKERTVFIAKGRKAPTVWGKLKSWVEGSLDAIGGQTRLGADDGPGSTFSPRKDAV